MKICKNAKELRSLHKSEDLLLVAVQENNGNRNLVVCAFTENHEDSVAICTPSGLDLAPFLNGKVKNIWDLTKPNYGWETLTGNDPYMEALESFKEAGRRRDPSGRRDRGGRLLRQYPAQEHGRDQAYACPRSRPLLGIHHRPWQ